MKYKTRKREVKRVLFFGALFTILMLSVINILIYSLNQSLIKEADLLFNFKFFMHGFFSIVVIIVSLLSLLDDYKNMRKSRKEKLDRIKRKLLEIRTNSKVGNYGDGI